ncbi:GNAT family N-acetyltransferase [Dactylosporangium matsuzakiense]|uniref:Acetyltransferase n=1 Tax=Dactylosporangium matsuzakiense TaxID=53360 RepID=A0A9W6KLY6_9ACTN|nr:GNAT family N-acetyltransferase [Dactylosporangium matsuzakiense]UWZ43641.1 GNAT family N-acetyltransferase [Dactylosporangium matsuzakiense]GLL04532.1 acetyltransferase [Dactylosporangium matsuzakiense]
MTVLTTERLRLQEMTEADLDDFAAILGDPAFMRFYPRPKTRAETLEWIMLNRRRYREHGHGLWKLTRLADGAFAGDCGLTIQRVDGVDELELGYHVAPAFQRTGLATEAARACRDWARTSLGATRVIAIIHPDNLASQRVALNTGLTLEKRTTNYGPGTEVMIFATAL